MKKNIKVIYWIELALLLTNLIFYLMIKVIPSNLNLYLVITFLLLMIIPLRLYFGRTKDKSYYTGYVNRTIITVLMIVGIIIYLLGLLLGFTKGYQITINNIVTLVLPLTVVLILFEYFRYIVVKNNYTNYKSTIVFTSLLALLEIFMYLNISSLYTSYKVFVFISLIAIPVVAEQFLCTYLSYKVGMSPCLLFRLIIKLYIYFIPIVPNLGDYLFSFVKILTPFIIFYLVNKAMLEDKKNKKIMTKNTYKILSIPIIICLIVLVVLVSGIFNNRLIAIASNSMAPNYYRGDAVIYEKMKPEELKKGDILVFKHNSVIVTHRIIDIKVKKGTYYYTTKGDANTNVDSFVSTSENVVGKVDFVVKYMGFPTVLINELFERG